MLAVALTPMTSRSLPNSFVSASRDESKTFLLTTKAASRDCHEKMTQTPKCVTYKDSTILTLFS